jgi:tetratricopeptide (TPR) repeat protein
MSRRSAAVSAPLAAATLPQTSATPGSWKLPDWLAAAGVFMTAASLRLAYWLNVRQEIWFQNPIIDSDHFHKWALNILHGNFLGSGAFEHGPLYAFFLALLYAVVGPDPARAAGLQLLLGAACCVLIFMLARRFFSLYAALAAGLAQAVYGVAFFHEGTLLTIVLINFLNLMLLISAYWAAQERHCARWIVPGIFLGLSFLARPSIGVFLGVLLLWMFWIYGWENRKFILRAGTLMVAAMVLVVAPATIRNAVVLHEWMISVPHGGMNFYIGNAKQAKGYHVILDNNAALAANDIAGRFKADAENALGRPLTYSQSSSYWFGKAWKEIFENPEHWENVLLNKFLLFFNDYEYTTSLNYYAIREIAPFLNKPWLTFKWVLPLALLGMIWPRKRWRDLFPLLGFVAVILFSNVAIMVSSEYRYAVMPVFFVFAAQGGAELVGMARQKKWLRLGVLLALGLLFFIFASLEVISKNERDYHMASAHSNFGHLLARLKNYQGASEEYGMAKDLVKFQPEYLSAATEELANTLIQMEHWDEARRQLEEAYALTPNEVSVVDNLATVATAQGRYEEAIGFRKRALELEPNQARLFLNLGMTYLWAGKDLEAKRAFAQALELSPDMEASIEANKAKILRTRKLNPERQ